ncbi:hypothetical protein SAMN05444817_11551 [Corynebacterium appendicis CIP 107643]|uniref:Uncharacterized protein n=1 Tax=Corynebacterium appendicis CIP 107643 TaxID=1161099 RepID=A0A1N7K8J9_9CORY|nr:hypothetical protein [Corynebacterium appendicis]WJY61733.1 hypothetical protein CAPP_09150 [Corynebacterium appendicis CIP 107643]SIS57911.1 hypothetical protein SAMN05444817_11551 [Corynebacterium appendicis CIP 107643]
MSNEGPIREDSIDDLTDPEADADLQDRADKTGQKDTETDAEEQK